MIPRGGVSRRDFLAGLACAGALGAAEFLRPRDRLILMPAGATLTALIPESFGRWDAGGDGEIVVPRTEGSLASRLYSDQLGRIYHSGSQPGLPVMLSIAYGSEQSDTLQLHRPEVCYPAIGFTIAGRRAGELALPGGVRIPTVSLVAHSRDRTEDIVYWTRLGNRFPRDDSEQRDDRLALALQGKVPDGVLVRASAVRIDPARPLFDTVGEFLRDLVESLPRPARKVLLGVT